VRICEQHCQNIIMKTFIMLVLSCASVLGADTGIRVVTTSTTNAASASIIHTQDIFTRDGQTNLIRITNTKDGAVQIQIHHFYCDGHWVGNFETIPDSSASVSGPGSDYSLSFIFGPSKDVKAAVIGTKGGVVVDAFTCTNGVFIPVESSLIKTYSVGSPDADRALHQWQDQWNEQARNK